MNIPCFEAQVDHLYNIASMRSESLDSFFLFLNYFDSPYFPMFLIPAIWVGISPKWGLRVALLCLASAMINDWLKYLLDMPRPNLLFPDLAMINITSHTPGFPSGGAQTAALMGGLLIYAWKSRWAWVIAVPYMFLISFSRLYLGVHYPMDVFGGFAIGLIILFIYAKSIRHIDKFCQTQGRGFCLLSCILLGALYLFLVPNLYFGHQLVGAFMGITLGYYVSIRFHEHPILPPLVWKRILSVALTILVAFGFFLLLPKITPLPVRSFIIAFWISALAIPFCRFVTVKNSLGK